VKNFLYLAGRAARFQVEPGEEATVSKKSRKNISNNSRRRRHKSRMLHPQETPPLGCVRGAADPQPEADPADADPCQDGTCTCCFPEED